MGLGSFWCYVWWLVLGTMLGWLLWWLLDRLFFRDRDMPRRLEAAERELADREAQLALHASELKELRSNAHRADMLSNQLAELNKEVDSRKGLEQLFETEYAKVTDELERAKRQLADGATEAARLKSELAALSSKNGGDTETLRKQLTESEARLGKADSELTAARGRIAALMGELENVQEQLTSTPDAHKDTDEIARLNAELDTSRKSAAEAKSLREELDRLKKEWSEATRHSAEAARLKLDYDARGERLARADAEITDMRAVLLTSKERLEHQQADIARLTEQLAAAGQTGAVQAKLAEQLEETRRSGLQLAEAQKQLEAELAATRSEEKRLREELAAAKSWSDRAGRLEAELDAARNNEQRLKAELDAARTSEQRLKADLATAGQRIATLDKLRLQLEAARLAAAGHASEVARLNDEIFATMRNLEPKGGNS